MSVYHFNDKKSPLDEMLVRHTPGGGIRAYLHAREGTTPEQLDVIKSTLRQHKLQWTPIIEEDKPCLEVRGFGKSEGKLLHILSGTDATLAHPSRKSTPDDKINPKDAFRNNTLRDSGFAYFIGDMGFVVYGVKEALTEKNKYAKYLDLVGGIFYALGTPFIAFFGRGDKSDIQFQHMSYSMLHEMEEKGVTIPQDASVRAVANGHNTTTWKKIKTFCYRYPAEITNSLFAVAGAAIFTKGAIKYGPATKKAPLIMDMGLGLMTVTAGLISVFVEEKPRKPGDPKKTGLARIGQFIEEKPLRAAGIALGISTLNHAGSTYVSYKDAVKKLKSPLAHTAEELKKAKDDKSALPFRALFVASNLTAEALMSISSKGHGAGVISDKSLDNSAYAVAADLVQRAPVNQREEMLNKVSDFLAERKHLGGERKTIVEGVRKQLEAMENNPWARISGATMHAAPDISAGKDDYWTEKLGTPAKGKLRSLPTHRAAVEMNKDNANTALNRA